MKNRNYVNVEILYIMQNARYSNPPAQLAYGDPFNVNINQHRVIFSLHMAKLHIKICIRIILDQCRVFTMILQEVLCHRPLQVGVISLI